MNEFGRYGKRTLGVGTTAAVGVAGAGAIGLWKRRKKRAEEEAKKSHEFFSKEPYEPADRRKKWIESHRQRTDYKIRGRDGASAEGGDLKKRRDLMDDYSFEDLRPGMIEFGKHEPSDTARAVTEALRNYNAAPSTENEDALLLAQSRYNRRAQNAGGFIPFFGKKAKERKALRKDYKWISQESRRDAKAAKASSELSGLGRGMIFFADPRPRDPQGQFSDVSTGGANPDAMRAAYGPTPQTAVKRKKKKKAGMLVDDGIEQETAAMGFSELRPGMISLSRFR